MKLVLDGAQQMLAKTAADYMAKSDGISRLRQLRDKSDERGFSADSWSEMADLGWTGIPFAEDQGGLGMGMAEVVLITEALGRGLAPEPYISAVVHAGSLLADSGSSAQKKAWIPGTAEGSKRLAVATQENGSRYDLGQITTTAKKSGDGWVLSGEKIQVVDGFGADGWIVSARTSGEATGRSGVSLFLIAAGTAGVEDVRQRRLDSRNASILRLNKVKVGKADLIGKVGAGLEPLEKATDRATVALCGEMLGIMGETFDRTLAYLKEREQFGVLIGSFQALQHRAATMFIERELSRSVVMAAARLLDEGSKDVREQVSNAKARCTDSLQLITNEGLQMHGGVGMTDEYDLGLFMKRARVCEMTFGDAAFHRNRFAELRGY